MRLKRQLFRPGRTIERIGKLAAHPFFARRAAAPAGAPPAAPAAAAPLHVPPPAPPQRGLLPTLAEHAGALFSIAISLVLLVALAALTYAFVRDIRRDDFELDTFSAPKEIAERGYTSTAIAAAVLDEIHAVQAEAFTLQSRRELEVASTLPDVQLTGGALSMRAIVRYARRLFDLPDNRISGEMLQDGKLLKLALRVRQGSQTQLIVVKRDDADVDRLLRDAGRALVQIADPSMLAVYLYGHEVKAKGFAETRSAIDYLLAHGTTPERALAYRMLGDVQRLEGHADDALASYRRYALLDPTYGPVFVVRQLVRMGRDSEALGLARERASVAAVADEFISLSFMMGALGRNSDRLEYARQSLQRDPEGAEPNNVVADSLYAVHRPGEALAFAERGWKLHPDDRDLPSTVAFMMAQIGRGADALEVCRVELAAWPGDLWCREARADAFASLGRMDEAFREYRYAIDNGNDSANLATHFGDALLATGEPALALVEYQAALAVEPHHWTAQTGWARAELALGHPLQAAERFAASAAGDPDDALLLREWARALASLGRQDEAAAKRADADKVEARLKIPLALQ
jgi:tetratricopeptide (TPR) repeat protein